MFIMKILHDVTEYKSSGGFLAVTLGNFDGLHLGHRRLLESAVSAAKSAQGRALLFTFWPHPARVLGNNAPPLLTDRAEKARLAEQAGIDYLLEQPFTPELAALSPADFVARYLAGALQANLLVVGYNFRFGRGGAGTAEVLRELAAERGIETLIVPPFEKDGAAVSSSRIRKLLSAGELAAANRLLGREYALAGLVMPGEKLGRKLGFPTANLQPPQSLLLPRFGVYAAYAECRGQTWPAVVNVGRRPTVGDDLPATVEAHLLSADGDFYGEMMHLRFYQEIRPEQKFASLDELKAQIAADCRRAREIL